MFERIFESIHSLINVFFPDINIQSVTHDSIEDARTALKLYHKHQEMAKDGGMENVREKLREMYEKGRKLQWKIPGKDDEDAVAAASLEESQSHLVNTLNMDDCL